MLNINDILETVNMIKQENLDIRTITMGISLFDCISDDQKKLEQKVYDKITKSAENLVMDRAERILLEVRESNIEAQNLYIKNGFEKTGLRKNYYSDFSGKEPENAVLMTKYLKK